MKTYSTTIARQTISETLLCHGSPIQFILFNFSNYSPSISMELKVSKEITLINNLSGDFYVSLNSTGIFLIT